MYIDVSPAATEILAFDAPADVVYGELRTSLERVGQPIGGNDLLLAAHAIAFGHTLQDASKKSTEFLRLRLPIVEGRLTKATGDAGG